MSVPKFVVSASVPECIVKVYQSAMSVSVPQHVMRVYQSGTECVVSVRAYQSVS